MTIEQYLGPLRPYLTRLSAELASRLQSLGVQPPSDSVLITALVATFLTLLLSLIFAVLSSTTSSGTSSVTGSSRRRRRRDTLLIVGVSGDGDASAVGKTTLFKSLVHSKQPTYGTTTSMIENEGTLSLPSSSNTRIVDFPGHPRLRFKLSVHLARARAILFVVDAQRFAAQARKDAALLFDILTNASIATDEIPVAIVINKRDLVTKEKLAPEAVRIRLEAELERARAANAGSLMSATVGGKSGNGGGGDEEDEETRRVPLGYDNEAFNFDHIPGLVTFVDASAKTGNVEQVLSFVNECFQ